MKKSGSKVWIPAATAISLPVTPRPQTLPLNELPWELFQRLCARLAKRSGDVEFSQEYGVPGQDQEGIDIYVRLRSSGRYSVWQCKRYHEMSKTNIKNAVDEFMAGDWLAKSDEFVICMSVASEERELADEIELQNQRLHAKGVALIPKGITQLSESLKQHTDLVDDFLGREWVRQYCGEDAAKQLSRHILNPEQIVRLRELLRRCYAQHFETVDPGLPLLTNTMFRGPQPLHLSERFIPPDVLEPRQILQIQDPSNESAGEPTGDHNTPSSNASTLQGQRIDKASRLVTVETEQRRPAFDWILEGELSVIIGDPGIGKSSLLRYLLLDLLSPEPRHESIAVKWGDRLPVWIPFPMWTRMVAENEFDCSLGKLLATWLTKVSAPADLLTLVQQGLEDSRLLLFVDGLDEWSNETAARTAVGFLEQFVGERNVPALASSRPLGFQRLGGLNSKWRRARLAPLTKNQQHEFAYYWFLHQSRATGTTNDLNAVRESEKYAHDQATHFVEDIYKDWRLAKLAEVPLLLSGLITLGIQKARLPRNRFKAYEELTRLLLQEQPQRRDKAAHARTPLSRITPETRESALACLAYYIHQSPGSDSLDKDSARLKLSNFLTEFLQKPNSEGIELADQILAVGTENVGILVEKSQQDIGFPHRAFQEFLAAHYLSNLPFDDQKEMFAELFLNPQWHDVLLCLCHLTTRAGEVDAFVNIIENISLSPELSIARQAFLAEVAFGGLHCSTPIARNLAKQIFTEIEIGRWMSHRERLLEFALDGLFSDSLRDETEEQIKRWFPVRHKYLNSVFNAMATWPRESETEEALWKGLFAEDESNQRDAAAALAKIGNGDKNIGKRLLDELLKPNEPKVVTYMLHSLCLGWPREPKIPNLLMEACNVPDWGMRIMAISHRVKRHEHGPRDRQILLRFIKEDPTGAWYWREESIEALVTGWPNDAEIKKLAVESLHTTWAREGPMPWDFAGPILMHGFPQDDEVASEFATFFREEEFPLHRLGFLPRMGSFSKVFRWP